ncbi:MAG: hypothetical protein HKN67_10660 [Saprospiraceae bacterium]|nr:hypothetical protein [Saprospiraceae bacterium]
MRNWVLKLILLFFCMNGNAQVFLQIETRNQPQSIKIPEGEILHFTLKEYPDVWRSERIHSINYEENLIVLEEGFYKIDDIAKVRLFRKWAKGLGYGLMQFSAGWFLYGGIASLASSEYTMSKREIIIGGAIAAAGFLINKLLYKRNIKLGKQHRLRIVDIRMFNPYPDPVSGP